MVSGQFRPQMRKIAMKRSKVSRKRLCAIRVGGCWTVGGRNYVERSGNGCGKIIIRVEVLDPVWQEG